MRLGRLAAAGLAAAGAAALLLAARANDPDVPTLTVETAPWVRRVVAEGNLRAVKSTDLTAPTPAGWRIYTIATLVDDGSWVRAGDVVVRFDPTEFEKDLEDGRADRAVADAHLAKADSAREATVSNLQRDADVAEQERDHAERFQTTDTTLYSRNEIVDSQLDTELAQARQEHAESAQAVTQELSKSDRQLLEIEKHKAQLTVSQAESDLEHLEVTAPHDGIVVLAKDRSGEVMRVGDNVFPGQRVATLPDLDAMEAEVYVLEADAGGLAPGQHATVTLEAHPDKTFSGSVATVEPIAQPRQRGTPVQYFRTVIHLATTDQALMKPGQRVRAEIVLDEAPEAVAVPRQAVFKSDGASVVYRRDGRGFDAVPVTLGSTGLGRVVITAGLEAGDEIALVDPTRRAEQAPETPTAGPVPAAGGPQ